MMSIKFITGDLFETKCDIIAHGCNAQGAMGSGVAEQIRQRFPQAYKDYLYKYKTTGLQLGLIQLVHVGEYPRFIANCITQNKFGNDGLKYVSYKAISNCMFELFRFAHREKYSIAMPKIGAGLAGGNWNTIYDLIKEQSDNYPHVVCEIYSLPRKVTGAIK